MIPEEHGFFRDLLDNLHDGVAYVNSDKRVLYWNRGAEQLSGRSRTDVMEREYSDGVMGGSVRDGETIAGWCPVAATLLDGLPREEEMFLFHKNGRRIPVWMRVTPVHGEEDQVVGAVQVFSDNSSRIATLKRIRELEEQALLDPLTGLGNRRYSQIMLRTRLDEFRRYGWAFGVLFIDLDFFKRINDEYGHDVGDLVLQAVGGTLAGSVRSCDFIGRWGGEEFIAILANITQDDLIRTAERCRSRTETTRVATDVGPVGATISIGAALVQKGDTEEIVLKRADRLMYKSKIAGRNRVTCAE